MPRFHLGDTRFAGSHDDEPDVAAQPHPDDPDIDDVADADSEGGDDA